MGLPFMTVIGVSDFLVGVILAFKPEIIYRQAIVFKIAEKTGLHVSDASTAPGFNNAIAVMVMAVGLGTVRAGMSSSKDAHAAIILMNSLWAIFVLVTVAVDRELASATHLMTGVNHLIFSGIMFWTSGLKLVDLFTVVNIKTKTV